MNDPLQMLWTQTWQIAVLAVAVGLCTRTIARNRPHLAHALWLLVLIKCVTPPLWGHSLGVFSQLQALTTMSEKAGDSALESVPPSKTESTLPLSVSDASESDSHFETDYVAQRNTQQSAAHEDSATGIVAAIPADEVLKLKSADAVRPNRVLWPGLLLSGLAIGASAALSVMIIRCLSCLRRIHQHRTAEFDDLLNERLQMLSKKLRLRRRPRIIVSDVLFGPAVLGVLRHTIVLPRCLIEAESAKRKAVDAADDSTPLSAVGSPLSSLDPILAHELLHIRRGDLRTGLLQAIVQSLWWFHPAVWFCNRWLSREAERCCDEQVIAELGCSPAHYARSLLSVIESKHALQPIPVFPGMKPVEITSQRMERIMSLRTGLKKQTPLWCWLAVAGLAIVVLPGAAAMPFWDEKLPQTTVPTTSDLSTEVSLKVNNKTSTGIFSHEPFVETRISSDLIAMLAVEQSVDELEATRMLKVMVDEAMNTERPISINATTIVADGTQLTVRHPKKLAARLETILQQIRTHGFAQSYLKVCIAVLPEDDATSLLHQLSMVSAETAIVGKLSLTRRDASGNPARRLEFHAIKFCKLTLREAWQFKNEITAMSNATLFHCRQDLAVLNGAQVTIKSHLNPAIIDLENELPGELLDVTVLPRNLQLLQLSLKVHANDASGTWSCDITDDQACVFRGPTRIRPTGERDTVLFIVSAKAAEQGAQSGFATKGKVAYPDDPFAGEMAESTDSAAQEPNDQKPVGDSANTIRPNLKSGEADALNMRGDNEFDNVARKWFPEDPWVQNANSRIRDEQRQMFFNTYEISRDNHQIMIQPVAIIWQRNKDDVPITITAEAAQLQTWNKLNFNDGQLGKLSSGLLEGNVRIAGPDGLRIEGEGFHISNDAQKLWTEHSVKFSWKKNQGVATGGAVLELQTDGSLTGAELVADDPAGLTGKIKGRILYKAVALIGTKHDPAKQLEVVRYNVADLVVRGAMGLNTLERSPVSSDKEHSSVSIPSPSQEPEHKFGPRILNVDFQPLTELIKTTIRPESWNEKEGLIVAGLFSEDKATPAEFLLSVRQTAAVHEEIEALLSAIRADLNQTVEISCRVMQIVTDSQLKGLEERASLYTLSDGQRWALLTKSGVDELQRFLTEEKVEVLAFPRILTPSGQAALVEVAEVSDAGLNGFRMSVNPHVIADSNVIRLSHSITIGEFNKNSDVPAHESLVGSGQTLVLLIEQPGKADATPDRYVVLLTPEHLTEEKVEATQRSAKQTESAPKP